MKHAARDTALALAFLFVALPSVSASEQSKAAEKEAAPLSAEERIRRAVVPPPGKECELEPPDEALVKLDEEHAKNLAFVTMSKAMLEASMETSEHQWRSERESLVKASKEDFASWLEAKNREGMTWTALPPCPESGTKPEREGEKRARGGARGLTSLIGMMLGPRHGPDGHGKCPPGDKACEEIRTRGVKRIVDASGRVMHCQPTETPGLELFSKVRARLVASRRGTNLLIASASNVPVECAVDVRVKGGKGGATQVLSFKGPGSRGGIVQEVQVGFSPNAYGAPLAIQSACVPRFVWGRSRTSRANSSR